MSEQARQKEAVQTQKQKEASQEQRGSVTKKFDFSLPEVQNTEKLLRQPRSQAYLALFEMMDMLSSTDEEIIEMLKENMDEDEAEEFEEMSDEEILAEIKAIFEEEFAEVTIELASILKGVISKCYITGCDCHAISPEGDILEHFNVSKPMPEGLEKGRIVFEKYPKCKCIEVYTNCCRVIQSDGEVIELLNNEI